MSLGYDPELPAGYQDADIEQRELEASAEELRREELMRVNTEGPPEGERTWTTDQLREEFDVVGFMALFVVAVRKSDGKKGSLEFTHSPRVYFGWAEV